MHNPIKIIAKESFYLDMAEGLARLDVFIKHKKLGAQTRKNAGDYMYSDGSRCAIGAMLPEELARAISSKGLITSGEAGFGGDYLSLERICNTPSKKNRQKYFELEKLQTLHDHVCYADKRKYVRAARWEQFIEYFESLKKKYGVA